MRVTDRYFGPIWYTQAQLNPRVPSIDVHFGKRWREKRAAIVRKESAVPVVPTAKFRKAGLDVTKLWLRQLHFYVVIVDVPDGVTIHREGGVFANSLFVMHILNAAVRLIAWQPVLFLELRTIATRYHSANA